MALDSILKGLYGDITRHILITSCSIWFCVQKNSLEDNVPSHFRNHKKFPEQQKEKKLADKMTKFLLLALHVMSLSQAKNWLLFSEHSQRWLEKSQWTQVKGRKTLTCFFIKKSELSKFQEKKMTLKLFGLQIQFLIDTFFDKNKPIIWISMQKFCFADKSEN